MKILVHGLNYAPEQVGIAVYTTGMAEALVRMGHEVRVVAGQPYYPAWRSMEGYGFRFSQATKAGVRITRVPHYVPGRPTGARRVLHHLSFALSSFFPLLWLSLVWRPQVVIGVAPSLLAAPLARLAAALAGAGSWLHVQDFELQAALATGLLRPPGQLKRFAFAFERLVLRSFETVSTISPQMCKLLIQKGVAADRVVEFRNWADVDAIRPLLRHSSYRAKWDIAASSVALYSGNIANKQGAEIVVDAARLLRHRFDLCFVICGEGPARADLEARAQGLPNIQFRDLQPKERLNELMGLASVHLLPQRAEAADLVLPSKLTNMLASGRPVVVTAASGTGLASEVEGCGLVTPPGDAVAFAAAIGRLLDDAALYSDLSIAARNRAVARWGGQAILAGFEARLSEGQLEAAELAR